MKGKDALLTQPDFCHQVQGLLAELFGNPGPVQMFWEESALLIQAPLSSCYPEDGCSQFWPTRVTAAAAVRLG